MIVSARWRPVWGVPAVLSLALICACGGGSKGNPTPPVADFSLQVSPTGVSIPAGGSAFVTVTLTRLNGFAAPVTLSGSGFPAGVVASGTIPVGSSTLQLPIVVDPLVDAALYSGLNIHGSSGTYAHDAAFQLTVAAALPLGHLRVDGVQASGGRQTGGTIENHGVARESLPANTIQDASDSTEVRHGFDPTGTPTQR